MVAWPPSGPVTVVILVVDYIIELTIHSLYVHPFCVMFIYLLNAFWLMVARPPSGPVTVVILVVDYISELTIHSFYVHPFCVKAMYNTSFIVKLMQQIVHSWHRRL